MAKNGSKRKPRSFSTLYVLKVYLLNMQDRQNIYIFFPFTTKEFLVPTGSASLKFAYLLHSPQEWIEV